MLKALDVHRAIVSPDKHHVQVLGKILRGKTVQTPFIVA